VVNIPNTTTKIAEKVWKNYTKKFKGKTKKNRKAEEWTTSNAKISELGSETPLTLYAQIQPNNEDVELSMWVALEDGFLSSSDHPDKYKESEKILNRYALEVKIETVAQELKAEGKTLSGLEKDMKKLKKNNENYHKDIKNSEKKIKESEKGLIQNDEDQKVAVRNVRIAEDYFSIQKDSLEDLISLATTKDEKKSLKRTLKGESKKVKDAKGIQRKKEKEEKKLRKTIENSKKTISESKEKIATNEVDQENKMKEIASQKNVIAEVQKRLDDLKSHR
jgi:septal ring factor EnvC (AmiA/AmiB activator)